MKYMVGGIIGGVTAAIMSLVWFTIGAVFTYTIFNEKGGARERSK